MLVDTLIIAMWSPLSNEDGTPTGRTIAVWMKIAHSCLTTLLYTAACRFTNLPVAGNKSSGPPPTGVPAFCGDVMAPSASAYFPHQKWWASSTSLSVQGRPLSTQAPTMGRASVMRSRTSVIIPFSFLTFSFYHQTTRFAQVPTTGAQSHDPYGVG